MCVRQAQWQQLLMEGGRDWIPMQPVMTCRGKKYTALPTCEQDASCSQLTRRLEDSMQHAGRTHLELAQQEEEAAHHHAAEGEGGQHCGERSLVHSLSTVGCNAMRCNGMECNEDEGMQTCLLVTRSAMRCMNGMFSTIIILHTATNRTRQG